MTFDQLIEYNMRNIFFEIHTQNVVEEPRDRFIKKSNLSLFLNQQSEMLRNEGSFYCMP